MSNQILLVKEKLNAAITKLCSTPWMLAKDPSRDFSRTRKLPPSTSISILLSMEGRSLNGELLHYFKFKQSAPSSSAFIQQRQKFNAFAFPALLNLFVKYTDKMHLYKGYRLLAADGSDIHIPSCPHDKSSYFCPPNGRTPYSLLHLDAVYDLLQHTYIDAKVCGRHDMNETGTLCEMVDRYSSENAIIIADRNYESYNLMAHIQEKGLKYIIRIKDIHSNGIAAGLPLPSDGEFDIYFPMHLTKRRNAEAKTLLEDKFQYKVISPTTPLDFLPARSKKHDPLTLYYLPFRVVRFRISDTAYETVITNLDADEFPPDELKQLYSMRWGIETSFRELKYTVGLLHFHAKKVENIIQEIFARLIMYNFSELITSYVVIQNFERKHTYKANFTVAVQTCRQFLLDNVSPPDVKATIGKNLSVIRTGRHNPRNIVVKRAVSFIYRVA